MEMIDKSNGRIIELTSVGRQLCPCTLCQSEPWHNEIWIRNKSDFKRMIRGEKKQKTLNAKLYVRILPSTDVNFDSVRIESNKKVIYVRCLQDLSKGVKLKTPNYWYFSTDGIFWNACQTEVYDTVTSGLYEELFEGVRAMILCYGQTGAGKTFTTSGLRFPYQDRGLVLRILSQLFEEKEGRKNETKISLGLSYVEFIGENIRDLISGEMIPSKREVREYSIPNECWAWKQIFEAETRKACAESAPYMGSNRGHSILTFYTHAESLIDTDPVISHSKIHIVDMGGIDNYGNKCSFWKSKLDLGNSNLSKSLMEQLILCLTGVSWKGEGHICPYKASRFLMYLGDTLRPQCLIRFIAHIYANESSIPVTISSLKFGERIRAFKPTKLEKIFEPDYFSQVRNLEREYLRLKDETELVGMLRDAPDYSVISQDQLNEIRRAAQGFLLGQLRNLTLFSLGQANITLEVFKELYNKLAEEKELIMKDALSTAADMLQSQLGEKVSFSNASGLMPAPSRLSKRKSRQQESSVIFGTSESGQLPVAKTSSTVQQVGVTDRKGISIGPGKNPGNFEGNVTKAFKKLRSRKSDSVLFKGIKSTSTKDIGVSGRNLILDDNVELPLDEGIPTREEAWQSFINENSELTNDLRTKVETLEEGAVAARRKYLSMFAELAKLRQEVDEYKLEIENCQHIRQICKKGEYDEEGNLIPGEIERKYIEIVREKEEKLNIALENCHVGLIDFRNVCDELQEVRKMLEEAFQEFCKENYKILFIEEPKVDLKSDHSTSTTIEVDENLQARMDFYAFLQNKLLSYVPKKAKKPWQKLF